MPPGRPDLAAELAARGWETGIDRTLLLAGPVPTAESPLDVRVAPRPEPAWVETWWEVDPRGRAPELESAAAIIARIREPAAFATVSLGGACAGVALGVVVDGLLVLECVATRPEARRRGVGRAAVGALGRWATEHGATACLLAVLEANRPGQRPLRGARPHGGERLRLRTAGRLTHRDGRAGSADTTGAGTPAPRHRPGPTCTTGPRERFHSLVTQCHKPAGTPGAVSCLRVALSSGQPCPDPAAGPGRDLAPCPSGSRRSGALRSGAAPLRAAHARRSGCRR